MTTPTLAALTILSAPVDQPTGEAFGMKKAMALMALVALGILVVAHLVDKARARNHPPTPPTYPLLDPPHGRQRGRDQGTPSRPSPRR